MRIEYTLTYRDWLLFTITHQFLSPVVQIFMLGPAALFYFITYGKDGSRAVGVIAAVMAYTFMWLLQIVFTVIYGLSRKNQALLTKRVIELQDDALYEETAYNRSYYYWTGIAKVLERPGFAAVYINAFAAHILPQRAFTNESHMTQFIAAIRERMRLAKVK